MKILKPMLGTSITRDELAATLARTPLLASFKLDGIRALVRDGVVLSRSLKPIPNAHVQRLFGRPELEGFDGELIVGAPHAGDVFRVTTSGVMSEDGEPDVNYYVFDIWDMPNTPMHDRAAQIRRRVLDPSLDGARVKLVTQYSVDSLAMVGVRFDSALALGYEGLVLRHPLSLYKYGRSTVKEAGLLKMKPFVDAEAVVVGTIELSHNANEAFTNELGRTARSHAKAGKVPVGALGALVCQTPEGVVFEIGTGFSAEERALYWRNRANAAVLGRTVKYKSLAIGVKDKPRSAVFLGFRDTRDQ
jgi:DNA ligase-1